MTKEFVPYEQALALKELGFNERCWGHYWENLFYFGTTHSHPSTMPNSPESCLAPTFSQAFRWFREKHGLDSFVKHLYKSTIKVGYYFGIDEYKGIEFQMDLDDYYKTYEEAELECLRKLIEIVKEKNL